MIWTHCIRLWLQSVAAIFLPTQRWDEAAHFLGKVTDLFLCVSSLISACLSANKVTILYSPVKPFNSSRQCWKVIDLFLVVTARLYMPQQSHNFTFISWQWTLQKTVLKLLIFPGISSLITVSLSPNKVTILCPQCSHLTTQSMLRFHGRW